MAVNAGTKMHDWLTNQIEIHNLEQDSHSDIIATERKGTRSEALDSEGADHIISDVSVLTQVLQNVDEPDNYWISLDMPNKTPQAFIFGANLDPKTKQSINVALSRLNYEGDTARLETNWQKTSSTSSTQ